VLHDLVVVTAKEEGAADAAARRSPDSRSKRLAGGVSLSTQHRTAIRWLTNDASDQP